MSQAGHSRPGRTGNRSGHVRCARKAVATTEHSQLRDKPLPVDGTAVGRDSSFETAVSNELSDYEWTAIKPMLPSISQNPSSLTRRNTPSSPFARCAHDSTIG